MHVMGLNVWAVLVCALATMVIGFVWYSPLLFANPWMKLMGYDPNDKAKIAELQKSAWPHYAFSLIASLLSAAVLAKIILISSVHSPLYGIKIALAGGLGFGATWQLPNC